MIAPKPIRILLADDHRVLRSGLRALLSAQADLDVVGEASDGDEALRLAQTLKPDVLVMDVGMPGVNGIDATARVRRDLPATKVLILSMHDDQGYLRQALRAGASGYVLKRAADTELLAAIRAAARGEVFLDPGLAKGLVEDVVRPKAQEPVLPTLSDREREVLHLLARGHTNQQVADRLCIGVKSVETYKARLMEKLGLKGRAELVRYALKHGVLKDTD
ncbi:MAG: DNA-binding response regulator [Zetaproteobacteria bacterium]|nr:MAG: DNA-binding response regulator [Zetaproteobacteria bacterium]